MTGRAQPNLTRTLATLEAAEFIRMKTVGRRKTPSIAVKRIVVEIDPTQIVTDSASPERVDTLTVLVEVVLAEPGFYWGNLGVESGS